LGYKIEDVIVFGYSIGTGVAHFVASKFTNIDSMILISPFLSMQSCYKELIPVIGPLTHHWSSTTFNNEEMIKQIKCPIFLFHGNEDKLINISHSMKLAKIVEETNKDTKFFMNYCSL
jgi:alpha-beta hydrolase superfamily lysophospholipase